MIGKDIIALAEAIKERNLENSQVTAMDYDKDTPHFGWVNLWLDEYSRTIATFDWNNSLEKFEYQEYVARD